MTSLYADNPSRWLVVYNQSLADSVAWVQWYAQQRDLPAENLLGLSFPSDELISEAAFEALRLAVSDYLAGAGLGEQVIGILCGHGVPGYYTRGDGQIVTIAAQLQCMDGASGPLANPTNASGSPVRPTSDDLGGCRLTARLDGPTLGFTEALSDRADRIAAMDPLDPQSCHLFVDACTVAPALAAESQQMADWARSLDAQGLRLPIALVEPTEPVTESGFDSISADGFYWGWNESQPPNGFFADSAGQRVFCVQPSPAVLTSPTLRDEQSDSWAMRALVAGYAATAGISRPVSLSAIPRIDWFFQALRDRWTLAEAWFGALPLLREGPTLVGDPLVTIRLPRSGWNVYGPFADAADVQTAAPLAKLPITQRRWTIDPTSSPAIGARASYLVQRIDEHGRSDGAISAVAVANHQAIASIPPDLPVWPTRAGWMARRVDQSAELLFRFSSRCRDGHVDRVELIEQIEGGQAQVVDSTDELDDAAEVKFSRPISQLPRRFRLDVYNENQVRRSTPYSAWITLPAVELRTVQATASL